MSAAPRFSVIVPAHQAAELLPESLGALAASDLPRAIWEAIVVDDGSTDGTGTIGAKWADRVLRLANPPRGPAHARNRGAEVARGEWLIFLDADVRVRPETLRRFAEVIDGEPTVDGILGAYDAAPPAPGFISRYRNLHHHFVHTRNAGDTATFWAGLGALRRAAFQAVGGFDEVRYPRPQVEDIELGYRLHDRGYRVVIRPEIQATHLKRWTVGAGLRTDLLDRGIPWTRLLLERGRLTQPSNLNLRRGEPIKVALSWLGLASAGWAGLTSQPAGLFIAGICWGTVLMASWPLHRGLARAQGRAFALAAAPWTLVYYLVSGLAVVVGTVLHAGHRLVGAFPRSESCSNGTRGAGEPATAAPDEGRES